MVVVQRSNVQWCNDNASGSRSSWRILRRRVRTRRGKKRMPNADRSDVLLGAWPMPLQTHLIFRFSSRLDQRQYTVQCPKADSVERWRASHWDHYHERHNLRACPDADRGLLRRALPIAQISGG
nr:hypothetical protein CFP56_21046 [Quercus suber]